MASLRFGSRSLPGTIDNHKRPSLQQWERFARMVSHSEKGSAGTRHGALSRARNLPSRDRALNNSCSGGDRLGKLPWNNAKGEITNDRDANRLVKPAFRQPGA